MSPHNDSLPCNTETEYLQSPETHQLEARDVSEENPTKNEEEEPLKSDDLNSDDVEVVVPPDGGWGWVVVFASFMCNMIVDGIIFSFGMFLKPIANSFDVSEAQVALVGSLMSGFYLIVGPFASALANRYGFRLVAIVGSVLGSASLVLSYFATSVPYLCVTFGVFGGIGLGFIYVPAVITVGFYFERWRALATGIGVCGSGIGTFLFAPISSALIVNLGWRSALLCQGGIVITCILFGLLFRPLKPTKIKDIKITETKTELMMDPDKLPTATRLKMEQALAVLEKSSCEQNQSSIPRLMGVNNNSNYPRASDVYHTISVPEQKNNKSSVYEKRLSIPFVTSDEKTNNEAKLQLLEHTTRLTIVPKLGQGETGEEETDVNRPLYRDDIFFHGSLARLQQYTSNTSIGYNLSVTRLPTKQDLQEEKKRSCKLCPEAVRRALATMLDFSLFKSPTFLVLAFGGFLTMMGFYVPFMYLTDRARISGMDAESAVFLISAIGIANTVGRVLCGILSSFPGVNALFVTNAALTIGGLATIFSGFSMDAEFQFTYTAVFGLSISCFASLRSIIVVDLLGLERLTNAFGLLLLFQGVAAAIGAPLAGAFKVATGSYDASFYLSGGLLLASAIMCYPLNWLNRWEMNRMNKIKCKSQPV